MKKTVAIILLVMIVHKSRSQSYFQSYVFCGKDFTIQCDPQTDSSILIKIKESGSVKDSFSTWTTNDEVFAQIFLVHFLQNSGISSDCNKDSSQILKYGEKLIRNYTTRLQNDEPLAGTLHISDEVEITLTYGKDTVIKYCDGQKKTYKKGEKVVFIEKGKVLRLKAEINDGYLENILAYVSISGKELVFTLPYPAGISSEDNFRKYAEKELYHVSNKPYWKSNLMTWSIKLDGLLQYSQELEVKRRDYSPKNAVVNTTGGTSIGLYKEETKKLLEAKIYSDFEGLNAEKPNGLVQAEITKRIGINTVQSLPLRQLYPITGSWGCFQYIAPVASINKIEANNKYLVLSNLDMLRANPGKTDVSKFDTNYHRYANILSLYQYQWISAGTDLNLLYFNNHDLKYEIYLNVGARMGLSAVSDSITTENDDRKIVTTGLVNNYSVSAIQFYPEVRLNFLPEERVSFSLSQKWLYFKTLSPSVQQASFKKDNPEAMYPKSSGRIGISELLIGVRTNPNSRMFGRARLNWELGNAKNNFVQFQVGYSTYILGNR